MNKYIAFGLGIDSELSLPELILGHAKTDVTIRRDSLDRLLQDKNGALNGVWVNDEEVVLHWSQMATFLIRGGNEIFVDAAPTVPVERVRLCLLGAAMGVLLCQRGLTVFHASAVSLNGKAVAFVGEKGWGKSTLCLALHAAGHTMIADDVLAVNRTQDGPMALPGFPQMKLWPDSVVSVGQEPATVPRLDPLWEKRDYRVTQRFSADPVRLHAVYVLGQGAEPSIESIEGSQAIFELLQHWYCTRFGTEVLQAMGYATHFRECTNLAKSVPIYRLRKPRCLSTLAEVVQLLETHCQCEYEGTCL
jgi:hypothetical protein